MARAIAECKFKFLHNYIEKSSQLNKQIETKHSTWEPNCDSAAILCGHFKPHDSEEDNVIP